MSFQGTGEVYIVDYSSSKASQEMPLTFFRHAGGKKLKPGERPADWPFEVGDTPKEMIHGSVALFVRQWNQKPKYGQKTAEGLAAVSLHRWRYTPLAWALAAFGMIGIVGCIAAIELNSRSRAAALAPAWPWMLLGVCVLSALLGFLVFGNQRQGRLLLEVNSAEVRVPCNRQYFATADIERIVVAEWEDTNASEFGFTEDSGCGIGLRMLVFLNSGERIELPTFFMDLDREKFVNALARIAPFPIDYNSAYREVHNGGKHFTSKLKFKQPWRDSEQVRPEWE
jgi:hypothetical protein